MLHLFYKEKAGIMTIEQDIFKRAKINLKSLKPYGFIKTKNIWKYEKEFMDGKFLALIEVNNDGIIKGKVIDRENEEEYLPMTVKVSGSAFAGIVKSHYEDILDDIKEKCAVSEHFLFPQSNRIAELILEKYNVKPDFPWKDYDTFGVFRNSDTNKWFALIMNIDKSKLIKKEKGEVDVINLKLDKDEITELIQKKGYYPAYHMNKKNWITLILDETLTDLTIMGHIDESYSYTFGKRKPHILRQT